MEQLDNPEDFFSALGSVMSASDEEFDRFLEYFSNMNPVTARHTLERQLRELIGGTGNTSITSREFTEVAIQLYMVSFREKVDITRFIHEVSNQFSKYRSVGEAKISPQVVEKRLSSIQKCNNVVSLLAKSKDVLNELPRKIIRTRILSDIRPIFADGVDKIPAATVLIHTLVLEYKEGSVEKQFHASFSSSALIDLLSAVNRAQKKEEIISELIKASEVTIIQSWSS